jgi:hypothetical protein
VCSGTREPSGGTWWRCLLHPLCRPAGACLGGCVEPGLTPGPIVCRASGAHGGPRLAGVGLGAHRKRLSHSPAVIVSRGAAESAERGALPSIPTSATSHPTVTRRTYIPEVHSPRPARLPREPRPFSTAWRRLRRSRGGHRGRLFSGRHSSWGDPLLLGGKRRDPAWALPAWPVDPGSGASRAPSGVGWQGAAPQVPPSEVFGLTDPERAER